MRLRARAAALAISRRAAAPHGRAVQSVEVQPVVGAGEQRLRGEVRQVLPVGGHAPTDRFAALVLGRPVLPARDMDARDQPAQVPLPGAGMGLVEVVEVEDEVALRRGVEAEVPEVRVTADDRCDAGGGQPGEVCGHDRGGTAEEGERVATIRPMRTGIEAVHPALVRRDHLLDGVGRPGRPRSSRPAPNAAPAAGVAVPIA